MDRHWPLCDLRLRTERLELRLPTDDDLRTLAEVALTGVHDPDEMPFCTPWTRQPDGTRIHVIEGRRRVEQRLVITADDWRARPRPTVLVEGLDPCREMFGAVN